MDSLVKKLPFINKLSPPVFAGDEQTTRQASLLNAMLITVIFFVTLLLPFVVFNAKVPIATRIIDILVVVVCVGLRFMLFQRQVKQTAVFVVVSGFLLISAAIASLGTIHTATVTTYLFIIIIAGTLFGLRGILISSFSCSLAVAGFIAASNAGLLPAPAHTGDSALWVIYTLTFFMVGAFTQYSNHATAAALAKARKEIAERKQMEHSLRKSESRFRHLFEQTHDAVFIIKLDGGLIAANQRAAEMLGYSVPELMLRSFFTVAAEKDAVQELFTRLLAGENIAHFEWHFQKKDGALIPIEISLEMVKDEEDRPLHIQAVARDIRERKKAEEALKTANEQLNRRVIEVERLHAEVKELAIRDPLTGMFNRRYLDDTLAREIARAARGRRHLSILIADIDHFKDLNDSYGHQAGDYVLGQLACQIQSLTRRSDFVCRYGGDEILLVLPDTSLAAAQSRAEAIRQLVESVDYLFQEKQLNITISMGIAGFPEHGRNVEEIIARADQAMYCSKQAGRNQVTIWERDY